MYFLYGRAYDTLVSLALVLRILVDYEEVCLRSSFKLLKAARALRGDFAFEPGFVTVGDQHVVGKLK